MIRKSILAIAIFLVSVSSHAAIVDTINIYSNAMQKKIKCVVIKPNGYKIRQEIKQAPAKMMKLVTELCK